MMSASPDRPSAVARFVRRVRGFVCRRWGTREWVVVFKSLADCPAEADIRAAGVRFFVAEPADVDWMAPQLGPWATWCRGGKPTPDARGVLEEQFANGDMTIIGVEDKPDGAVVFVLVYAGRDFSTDLLGDAFKAPNHVVARRAWVAPACRGRGVASAGTRFAHARAAQRGIDGIWGFILVGNDASLRLHGKLGYEQLGWTRIVTRLKRRYVGLKMDASGVWRTKRIPFERSGL